MPKVSVIIPSYNHADYVQQAVESVLNQRLTELELIIIDDGSQDNSLDILSAFSDSRIRLISQSNKGAHAALNRGLNLAQGSYITILNSDDIFLPDRLEMLTTYMDQHPEVGLVGTYIDIIDKKGDSLGIKHGYRDCSPWELAKPEKSFRSGGDLKAALWTENYFATTSNFLFRSDTRKEVGDFRPLRYVHDWDFALRLSQKTDIALLDEPLVKYRVHGENTINENKAAMIFEILWLLAVHLPQNIGNDWLSTSSSPANIDQLLHSLYAFDLDRVLTIMLLQNLSNNPEKALLMLDPTHPMRTTYLNYIQENLPPEPGTPSIEKWSYFQKMIHFIRHAYAK